MNLTDFTEFQSQLFGKKNADKKENVLIYETESILNHRIIFAKEF